MKIDKKLKRILINLIFFLVLFISLIFIIYLYKVEKTNKKITGYQKISKQEAIKVSGIINIPFPKFIPNGYTFDGIYLFKDDTNNNYKNDKRISKVADGFFELRFRNKKDCFIIHLYGGDARNDDTIKTSGGDIPTVFNLQGEKIKINKSNGILQTNLNKQSFISHDYKIHTRLFWRIPCNSSVIENLRGIFLLLETHADKEESLSVKTLIDIAESVIIP